MSEYVKEKEPKLELSSQQVTMFQVIKRNGQAVPFDVEKIKMAMRKAYLATKNQETLEKGSHVYDKVAKLSEHIFETLIQRTPHGSAIHIESIQDMVELELMRSGEHDVARSYVLYREQRRLAREKEEEAKPGVIRVQRRNGKLTPLDDNRIKVICQEACRDVAFVDAEEVVKRAKQSLFDGVPFDQLSKSLVMSARSLVEKEPEYTYVAARLLLDQLRQDSLHFLGMGEEATFDEMAKLYPENFMAFIHKGVELELLDPELKKFDLKKLGKALLPERDLNFTYLSMQTLYDRYFIHSNEVRFEMPQVFFMRVAMGLALREEDPTERAIEFYRMLSSFDYMSSTPTLFNAGTLRSQLSSCYLTTIGDDLADIFHGFSQNALLSKFAGGLGNSWTSVRGMNAKIKGTNGRSRGVIPFLKIANDVAVAVNQGGKRKGAVCAYLEVWHSDIEDFLDLRKNSGDDRRRTHDMNTACWVPDLFMKTVHADGMWYLFSPDEVPELHDIFGEEFEQRYQHYMALADKGDISYRKVKAKTLWRKMLSMVFETGHPWITFKDPCNIRSPQQHVGTVHSSNLCTEITLNTSKDEIAVCNLGSVNMVAHLDQNGQIDCQKLKKTVTTAMRMLDNVIDINYYSVPEARVSNLKHRPVGLGLMGFQDALYAKGISYDSQDAVDFADHSMELISYYAIEASCDLAKERGQYETFEGSLWSQGVLPIDSIKRLQAYRGETLAQNTTHTLDWDHLRNKVRTQGMRNSNTMAIAPTATISNICGVSQSIEPTYQNLYVKSNLSGEFTVINPYLVKALRAKGLWDSVMVDDLKYFNGSVQKISRVPNELKNIYANAFEIDSSWLIEAGSRRMKWIDQSQSLNLYVAQPSGKKLDSLYKLAWKRGLKTTYYLRSLGATQTEKSTINRSQLNAVDNSTGPKVCSILDPDCDACQ